MATLCASLLPCSVALPSQAAPASPAAPAAPASLASSGQVALPATAITTTAVAPGQGPAAGAPEALTWPGAECPDLARTAALQGDLTQSMNGGLTGCLRVPVVLPGNYYVSLQDILEGTAVPPGPTTSVAPAGPQVALSVSPATAAPGENVRLTGRVASPLVPRPGYGIFCWDGCHGGLEYDGAQLAWLSPTTFSAQLTLPDAPWVEQSGAGGPRVVSPVAGTYPLAVECLVSAKGCALGGPEGQTTVRLRSSARYTCESMSGCAKLSAPPGPVHPGQLVQFSGYAPLESIIGSHYPFAFQLSAGTARPAGPGVVFVHLGKGGVQMDVGAARVNVAPALAFSSLRQSRPLSEIAAGAVPISANPGDRAYVGWCAPGYIEVQGPGGRSQVPLAAASRLLAGTGAYQGPVHAQCDDLALAGTAPGPDFAAFAAFEVLPTDQDPMVADVALFTTDAGQSWSFVPTPPGAKRTSFGGFRYVGRYIDALFSANTAAPAGRSSAPLVEQTSNSGKSWQYAPFSCPLVGPCVAFGAHMPGNCAQGLDSQPVITSADNGRRWAEPPWPGALVTCWLATLVATSPAQAILVTSNTVLGSDSPFDALVTDDGGKNWQVVYVPALPSLLAGPPPQGPGDVVVLPDGGLLSVDASPWHLLVPGASAWCSVRTPDLAIGQTEMPMSFAVIGDDLWWLSGASSGNRATAHDVASASLTCAR